MTAGAAERPGYATFVLHTHLPYCRLAGRWPHGEEWIHEAMLECYLPLLASLRRMASEGDTTLGVTINMTPILSEQLVDPLVVEHFREFSLDRAARAERDIKRFRTDPVRRQLAIFHYDRYNATRDLFEQIDGDFVGALRAIEDSGHIEIATSAATHAYLPLLKDSRAVEFQVRTGIESHVRHFGRRPRSFWLPECAYEPGIEEVLDRHGVRVFFVETHLVENAVIASKGSHGRPGSTFEAYRVANSNVTALARNNRTGKQVWSAEDGYPGDGAYREFHKKEDESGLRYWRITGPQTGLGDKALYEPVVAQAAVAKHARHFVEIVRSELATAISNEMISPLLLSAYDTELFGHWWMEGVPWLEAVIRELRGDDTVELTTASDYVATNPPAKGIVMAIGSWGNGGDDRTWQNEQTAWTWDEIALRQTRAAALLREDSAATRQLARELLLLQASDWQFLITTGQAAEYAAERFRSHCERFDRLAAAIEAGSGGEDLADGIEWLDNPFPFIDVLSYMGSAAPGEAS